MFITASRKKIRFATPRGELDVESLWDLNLESLDRIAVAIDAQVQKAGTKSFIGKRDRTAAENELKLEIVKAVIETKMAEAEEAKTRAAKKGERQFLKDLLVQKRTDSLSALTAEEIEKRIAELGEEE